MADSAILPEGCALSLSEKDVLHNTLLERELPCIGCFKRTTCAARKDQELRFAHTIMDEPLPESRICKRCNSPIVEWKISGSTRVWRCVAGERGFPCGWELSEFGASAAHF